MNRQLHRILIKVRPMAPAEVCFVLDTVVDLFTTQQAVVQNQQKLMKTQE